MGMARTIIQVVGAVVSALYTTVSLYPDLDQSVTGGWPWAPLVSFAVFVSIISWVLFDKQSQIKDLSSGQPKLELGEPRKYPNEILQRTKEVKGTLYDGNKYQIAMYRVPVTNRGSHSSGVAVKLTGTEPEIPGGEPVMTLHKTGDNPSDKASYKGTFPMGDNEPVWVDVIAVTKDSPHKKCFIYSISSHDSLLEIQLNGRYIFTLTAIAEKSSAPIKYQVDVDIVNGQLSMIKL
jgi:hypothetical protein